MKIKFLGAAGMVTGSSYVLTSGSGQSILIDLGMFQGLPEMEQLNYARYEFDCRHLLGVVLTHAHLDHCGRLPILFSHGFTGTIWMTSPTRDLTEISLLDSAKIASMDNRKVLYDKNGALKTIAHFNTVGYHSPIQIGDFTVRFYDAGHILGSASVIIEDSHPDSGVRKIVFSGDLGNSPGDLTEKTEYIDDADAVVMESTYGDKQHPREDPATIVQSEINSIEASGGTLLIPAFALERTQELLHMLKHLKKEGKILESTPVFMDSPMAQKATDIYLDYPADFNSHIQDELKNDPPFEFPGLVVIERRSDSEALYDLKGHKVIIAGGGMMTGGRILSHAREYLPLASSRLLIVGYQGEGTLGRQLKEGAKNVTIYGQEVGVQAVVSSTNSMSSHADQSQLMKWLKNIKNVKKVIITHGEDPQRTVLAQKITDDLGITDVLMPILNQEISM